MFAAWQLSLLVAIAVEPADDAVVGRVVSGCRAALGPRDCVRAGTETPTPALEARVRLHGNLATVEVKTGGAKSLNRSLEFDPQDTALVRATAAGLLVAALSLEISAEDDQAPDPTTGTQPAQADTASSVETPPSQSAAGGLKTNDGDRNASVRSPAPTPTRDHAAPPTAVGQPVPPWVADVGGTAAPPIGSLPWLVGGGLDVALWPTARLGVGVGARVESSTPGGLTATRLRASAGPQLELWSTSWAGSKRVVWSTQAALQMEQWGFEGGLSEPREDTVRRFGALVGTRAAVTTGSVGVFLGLEAAMAGNEIQVLQGDFPLGTVPRFAFGMVVGARVQGGTD